MTKMTNDYYVAIGSSGTVYKRRSVLEDRWRAFKSAFEDSNLEERVRLIDVIDPEEEFRVLIEDHLAEQTGSLDENLYADL
jgi:hypothetical protein